MGKRWGLRPSILGTLAALALGNAALAAPLQNGAFDDGFLHWQGEVDDGFTATPVDPATDADHFDIVSGAAKLTIGDPLDVNFIVTLFQVFDFPGPGQSVNLGFTLIDSDFAIDMLTVDNVVADPAGLSIGFDLDWMLSGNSDFVQVDVLVDGILGPVLFSGDGTSLGLDDSRSVVVDVSSLAVATAEPPAVALLLTGVLAAHALRRRRSRARTAAAREDTLRGPRP